MRVRISASELAKFRRRALRHCPKELIEAMWGVREAGEVLILVFTPVEHTATQSEVFYEPDDVPFGRRQDGLTCLGVIHTHTGTKGWDASPSETDWEDSQQNGEIVTGICRIVVCDSRRRCRIRFFAAKALCDLEVT